MKSKKLRQFRLTWAFQLFPLWWSHRLCGAFSPDLSKHQRQRYCFSMRRILRDILQYEYLQKLAKRGEIVFVNQMQLNLHRPSQTFRIKYHSEISKIQDSQCDQFPGGITCQIQSGSRVHFANTNLIVFRPLILLACYKLGVFFRLFF